MSFRHQGLTLLFAWLALATFAHPAAAQQKKRNVIVIIADDMRWDCMSCAGHKHLKTPNLDKLARQGVRFKNAFCTTSLCSPSRASILSGLYAHRHGVRDNFTEFPAKIPSFAELLRRVGYVTAYIGKWHMGEDNDAKRPGFDYWVSHKGQGKYFDNEFNIGGKREVKKGYYTHVVTDLAIDWIKKQGKQPFALILGHKAPHSFYEPEPKYAHSFDEVPIAYPKSAFELEDKPAWIKSRLTTWHGIYGPLFSYRKNFPDASPEGVKDFAAMIRAYWSTIRSIDDSVGRLMDALGEAGILDDTIIIFVGDNGLLNGEHGMVDKRTMHEPSIRVPMLLRYPPLFPPGNQPAVVDRMVLHIDMAPSILDMCGAAPIANVQGRSWKKLAQGDATGWRTSWMYEYNYEKQFPYTPNVRGVRTDDWAYMHYPHGDGKADRHKAELYHLTVDPDQNKNLINDPAHAAKLEELRRELDRLRGELNLVQDVMPLDEGISQKLPDQKIR